MKEISSMHFPQHGEVFYFYGQALQIFFFIFRIFFYDLKRCGQRCTQKYFQHRNRIANEHSRNRRLGRQDCIKANTEGLSAISKGASVAFRLAKIKLAMYISR
jgi:hypothetical protein